MQKCWLSYPKKIRTKTWRKISQKSFDFSKNHGFPYFKEKKSKSQKNISVLAYVFGGLWYEYTHQVSAPELIFCGVSSILRVRTAYIYLYILEEFICIFVCVCVYVCVCPLTRNVLESSQNEF